MYTDSSLITPALTDLLKKNEEVQFIERGDKQALMGTVRMFLFIALGAILLFDGYLFSTGMLSRSEPLTKVFSIFFWNIPAILCLGAAYRSYKRIDSAFYAVTNMRVIYTKLSSWKKMDFVYFKDIHEVSADKHSVKVDLNDYSEYTKRFRHIQGVKDPKSLCDAIDTRLESFRLGPQ